MDDEAKVVDTGGELPSFWDRSAIFMANLLAMFFENHAEAEALKEMVGEVDSYGGRLVPILNLIFCGADNLLLLEREPDAGLCAYFESMLGLSLPKYEILRHGEYERLGPELAAGALPEKLRHLKDHPARWMDGFVTDQTISDLADATGKKTLSTVAGSRLGNNKLLLHRHLESAGLPVVDTFELEADEDCREVLRALRHRGFGAAVIKAPVGASGIGMLKVPDLTDAALPGVAVPPYYFHEGPCLVQGWLQPGSQSVREVRSPSVQMFVNEDAVYLYDITEQILSEASVHEGNESPPPLFRVWPELRSELLRQAGAAGRWLHAQGYRGTASADFLVIARETPRPPDVYVCEINARVTGATYPSVLARHFHPAGAWLLRNLRFRRPLSGEDILSMLRANGHLFDPSRTASGILPINFNFGEDGLVHKGQFLCLAPSKDGSHSLLDIAKLDLPVAADIDRD